MKFPKLLLLALVACHAPEPPLPETPEAVARLWQSSIDKNQFDLARRLSTGEVLAYINEMAAATTADSLDTEANPLLNLQCRVAGDSAFCSYHFVDELGEQAPGTLTLVRVRGQWLVCRTDAEEAPEVSPAADSLDVELE